MNNVFDLVIDAQYDFMRRDGALYVPGAEAIIPSLQDHILGLNSRGVLFTYDTHLRGVYEASEEAKEFPIHCIKGTAGWHLVVDPYVCPVPLHFLEKGVFDMWKEPGLEVDYKDDGKDRDKFFTELKGTGVSKVRVVGVAADYCVKWAIDGLVARGFEVEVVRALTMGIQRDIEQVVQDEFPDHVHIT